jgi:hypothetical protein
MVGPGGIPSERDFFRDSNIFSGRGWPGGLSHRGTVALKRVVINQNSLYWWARNAAGSDAAGREGRMAHQWRNAPSPIPEARPMLLTFPCRLLVATLSVFCTRDVQRLSV